nr:MAG TPA: hypothetical protein [Caudoviricetes sp.]
MKFCDERIQKHLIDGGKIKRTGNVGIVNCPIMFNNCLLEFASGGKYPFSILDLTVDTWEIVEPEYNWDKIIKDKVLCQFWDGIKKTDDPCVGYLSKKAAEGFYRKGWNCSWLHCKPFNPAEFNIAKDLNEYEK